MRRIKKARKLSERTIIFRLNDGLKRLETSYGSDYTVGHDHEGRLVVYFARLAATLFNDGSALIRAR